MTADVPVVMRGQLLRRQIARFGTEVDGVLLDFPRVAVEAGNHM